MFKLDFKSNLKQIEKDMAAAEKRQRAKAARYLDDKLKEEATQRFGSSSEITKGVAHRNDKYSSRVGVGPDAYAAHLIEFGTDKRFTTKGIGSGEKGTGFIAAKPFVFPTFDENSQQVINIMQEVWF